MCGIDNNAVRERLLRDNALTLDKAISTVRAAETSQAQDKNLTNKPIETATVQAIKANPKSDPQQNGKPCRRCGTKHLINQCPAYGQTCLKCQGKNHYAKMCFSPRRKLHEVTQNEPQEDVENSDELFLGEINKPDGNELFSDGTVNNDILRFKIDTGPQCNLIPYTKFTTLRNKPTLHKTDTKLTAYGGTEVPIRGKCYLNVEHNNKKLLGEFYIVEIDNSKPLIGLQTCCDLDLITTNNISEIHETEPSIL